MCMIALYLSAQGAARWQVPGAVLNLTSGYAEKIYSFWPLVDTANTFMPSLQKPACHDSPCLFYRLQNFGPIFAGSIAALPTHSDGPEKFSLKTLFSGAA